MTIEEIKKLAPKEIKAAKENWRRFCFRRWTW